jgi:uncharacterized protein YjbJ (UPF0337 family)
MGGKFDDMKGRVKEAAGDLTDDDELRDEGRTDRMAGTAKEKIDQAGDKLADTVDDLRDKVGKDR